MSDITRRDLLARAGGLAAAAMLPGELAGATVPFHATRQRAASDRGVGDVTLQEGFPRKTDFVIPDGITYLNGAYTHPMPTVVRDAVREYNDRRAGFMADASPPDMSSRVKAKFAALINADPSEIAFVPNTSTGEVLVVHGLGIPGGGGNVVTDALHFEGAIVHLQALERTDGLDLRIVMPRDGGIDLEDLDRVIDRSTRLVELSWVTMYNGFQHDLTAVCELAHAKGAYVYADVIQGAGASPLDVRATGVDFLACAGFKWLMGDLGLGFLYAKRELLDGVVRRTQYGYHSASTYDTHFLAGDRPGPEPFSWELGTDASAVFEVGSVAGSARAALGASLDYLQRVGVANIERHRQPLLRRLREEMPRLGFECVTPEGSRSPIITFAIEDAESVRRRVSAAGVDVRVAERYIRFSPSVYNDLADVDRALEALS